MLAIKARILQIWQSAMTPVRICCVKFAQRVVLAQTNAGSETRVSSDLVVIDTERRSVHSDTVQQRGLLDVSLEKVPNDHQNLDPRMLEGEAMGLLDRMLIVLQENSR